MTLRDTLRHQGKVCTHLGSPFTGQLLRVIADNLRPGTPLADRLLGWSGDIGPAGASVPLRLAGALHGLVLDGQSPALRTVYPPNDAPDDASLWSAVETALGDHAARLDNWLNRPPQTNEVGRSAVLIALGHWLTGAFDLPLTLSELGASAGLNLGWDRYALQIGAQHFGPADPALHLTPDWTGDLPPDATPRIADRRGADLTPLDPQDPGHRLRLCAYIWPDQPHRLNRTRAALAVADAPVDRADAADWLDLRLTTPRPGQLHLIFSTIAWQYFPPPVQARAKALIETAGATATADAPLAWFGMEADNATPGAGLTLRIWPGNHRIAMGRADFHGRWVDWTPGPAILE